MEQSRMTQDDVLFGYRLQLFALTPERGVLGPSDRHRVRHRRRHAYAPTKTPDRPTSAEGVPTACGTAPLPDPARHPATRPRGWRRCRSAKQCAANGSNARPTEPAPIADIDRGHYLSRQRAHAK